LLVFPTAYSPSGALSQVHRPGWNPQFDDEGRLLFGSRMRQSVECFAGYLTYEGSIVTQQGC